MAEKLESSLTEIDWLHRLTVDKKTPTNPESSLSDNININNPEKEENTSILTIPKPPYSYACLIANAINSSTEKKMKLNEIYDWICTNYPFYKKTEKGWKNSVRHILSLGKSFHKAPRNFNTTGKGSYWYIDDKPPPTKKQRRLDTAQESGCHSSDTSTSSQQASSEDCSSYLCSSVSPAAVLPGQAANVNSNVSSAVHTPVVPDMQTFSEVAAPVATETPGSFCLPIAPTVVQTNSPRIGANLHPAAAVGQDLRVQNSQQLSTQLLVNGYCDGMIYDEERPLWRTAGHPTNLSRGTLDPLRPPMAKEILLGEALKNRSADCQPAPVMSSTVFPIDRHDNSVKCCDSVPMHYLHSRTSAGDDPSAAAKLLVHPVSQALKIHQRDAPTHAPSSESCDVGEFTRLLGGDPVMTYSGLDTSSVESLPDDAGAHKRQGENLCSQPCVEPADSDSTSDLDFSSSMRGLYKTLFESSQLDSSLHMLLVASQMSGETASKDKTFRESNPMTTDKEDKEKAAIEDRERSGSESEPFNLSCRLSQLFESLTTFKECFRAVGNLRWNDADLENFPGLSDSLLKASRSNFNLAPDHLCDLAGSLSAFLRYSQSAANRSEARDPPYSRCAQETAVGVNNKANKDSSLSEVRLVPMGRRSPENDDEIEDDFNWDSIL